MVGTIQFSLQNYIDHISQIDYSVGMYVYKRIREFMDISMSI